MMNRTPDESRLNICKTECPYFKSVRGNNICPIYGKNLKVATKNPKDECPKGYWSANVETSKVNFYRNKNVIIDLQNQWLNSKCFLVCNGPSRDDFNLDLLKRPGIATMTINNGGNDFRSTFWTCQDTANKFMDSIWLDPTIMKFTSLNNSNTSTPNDTAIVDCPNVFFHKRSSSKNLKSWFTGDSISWNTTRECGQTRSTMLAAIHILYVLGFRTIYVIGADFHMSATQKYCFAQNRGESSIKHNNAIFSSINRWLDSMDQELKYRELKILKCGGAMNVPIISFEKAVADCEIDITKSTEGMY